MQLHTSHVNQQILIADSREKCAEMAELDRRVSDRLTHFGKGHALQSTDMEQNKTWVRFETMLSK